jgi:hypothetical protein
VEDSPLSNATRNRAAVSWLSNPLTLTTWVFAGVAAVLLALGLFVAVVLPYGAWDAMTLGIWSRLIGEHWPTFHFHYAQASLYQRPLFFELQGLVWHLFGFHQVLGRLLSFAFGLLLVASVAVLAGRATPPYRKLSIALAVLLLLTLSYFEIYMAAGLTDVPVSAMIALTAAVLVIPRLGRARLPLVALAAALAMVTKPSALPSLVGLGIAVLIGSRAGLRRRSYACGALAAGVALSLVYDYSQARYTHLTLIHFIKLDSGSGFYETLADSVRRGVLLDGAWLGPDLRVLLWFAFAYAVVRIVGIRHRLAVAIALPVAAIWSWLGPHMAGAHGVRVGIFNTGTNAEEIATLVLVGSIVFALWAPEEAVPDRLRLLRLMIWAFPTLVAWGRYVPFDDRLLAPAWPPLILLLTWTLLPAFAGARRRSEWLIAVPAAAVVVLALYAAYNINGLGPSGWHALRSGGISALGDGDAMRGIALGGDFANELNALAPQVGKSDKIISYDGRLKFYYLDQATVQMPLSCEQAHGYSIFVLLEDDEVRTLWPRQTNPTFWSSCTNPAWTKVDERPGAYTIFVAGTPKPTAGGCVTAPQDQGLAVEFGRMSTAAEAQARLKYVLASGFVQAKVEQLGCSLYRVVETGIPNKAVGDSIVAEATHAGIAVKLVNGTGG